MELNEYLKSVAAKVDMYVDEYSKAVDTELQEASSHLPLCGGKRLRPAIVLLTADSIKKGSSEDIFMASIALEWAHTFTLVHDDIFMAGIALEWIHIFTLVNDDITDDGEPKRGKAAVHKVWNPAAAILAGVVLYSKAFEYICCVKNTPAERKLKAVQMLANTCYMLCEGQQEDISFESRDDVTMDEYINMVRKKTGALYAASFGIGAILAGANAQQIAAYYNLGVSAGIAFHMQDDVIDLTVPTEISGKTQGSVLRENKQTAISILARSKGLDLSKYHKEDLTPEELNEAIELIKSYGIIDEVHKISRNYMDVAKGKLDVIPESEEKDLIIKIVDYFATKTN